jgi:DNA-binding NarL/FixJ family response regulator
LKVPQVVGVIAGLSDESAGAALLPQDRYSWPILRRERRVNKALNPIRHLSAFTKFSTLSIEGEIGASSRAMSKSPLGIPLKRERLESPETKPLEDSDVAQNTPLPTIVLIENRLFIRDCIARTLDSEFNVASFSSVAKWMEAGDAVVASLILWCISGQNDPQMQQETALLVQRQKRVPVILVSEAEDFDHVICALKEGARGYIPTSVSLEVAIQAIYLVHAGGTYVPASSLVAAQRSSQEPEAPKRLGTLTARQTAVVEALRKGKANKIIAYELNMRESTVKVHVRSIMKKLKAKNRTEVAFLTNGLFSGEAKTAGS